MSDEDFAEYSIEWKYERLQAENEKLNVVLEGYRDDARNFLVRLDDLSALRAENEKLQWELDKALDTLVAHDAVCAENEKLRAALKGTRVKALNEGFDIAILFNGMRRSEIAQAFERAKAAALKETGE